jgi:eukaryotic-like serine/threonine-protein kinase
MGSPLYMSPEQMVAAKSVDARCDIWALGVILYELVTGGPPFIADSMTEIIALVLQAQPEAAPFTAVAPPELTAAVMRCLEKDPARRFQNVGELATALAPFAARAQRQTAERVSRVLGTPVHPVVSYRPHDAPPSAPLIVAASTNAGWDQTRTRSEEAELSAKPSRITWTLVAAAVAATVLAAVAFVALRRPASKEADPGVSAAAGPPVAASAPAAGVAPLGAVGLAPSAAPVTLEPPRDSPKTPEGVAPEAHSAAGVVARGAPASSPSHAPPHAVQAAAPLRGSLGAVGAPAAHSPAPSPASPQPPSVAATAKNPLQIDLK